METLQQISIDYLLFTYPFSYQNVNYHIVKVALKSIIFRKDFMQLVDDEINNVDDESGSNAIVTEESPPQSSSKSSSSKKTSSTNGKTKKKQIKK
ncbi:unnamed protein product [Rotaria magnacalcarata]|uniref:Uncharacterized protein n=1 Tax=Rotaria magnacalcarata TaxID=392030 RepID=A0A8S3D4Z9_9BILA|nr:unnamed protein product [Rotaria magnacalcarata]